MTPDERAEHRAYMARKKAESRLRKRAEGKCIVCGANDVKPGLNPRKRTPYATCRACDLAARERNAPNVKNMSVVRLLYRDGLTVSEIVAETQFPEEYVVRLLKRAGWELEVAPIASFIEEPSCVFLYDSAMRDNDNDPLRAAHFLITRAQAISQTSAEAVASSIDSYLEAAQCALIQARLSLTPSVAEQMPESANDPRVYSS